MCGIAGLIVFEHGRIPLISAVERMQSALRHRGPDDEGMFISSEGRVALAHTRLSILDLSFAGRQPMGWGDWGGRQVLGVRGKGLGVSSETRSVTGHPSPVGDKQSARYWIVFNGEIYNYRKLREELDGNRERSGVKRKGLDWDREGVGVRGEATIAKSMEPGAGSAVAGHLSPGSGPWSADGTQETQQTRNASTWKSNSDTEVILRAYARWGRECVNHLRGMFAFAIWDENEQELFLARDPFGIKPLYYYESDGQFLFASEIRALLASGLVPRKLSREGLATYLQYGSVQDPLTIVEGIHSLLPGHCLTVKRHGNRLEIEQFSFSHVFTPHASRLTPNANTADRDEAVSQLRHILEDSVRAHLVSDVPIAAFLSGGIDSSAIVGLMSRVSDERPRTFNVSFDEAKFSEKSYANLIARKFKTEHEDIRLSAASLLNMLPDAFSAMDQPTMDGINSYVVSKAVRDAGIKVALSGLGGDELFAGYPSFRRAMQLGRLANAPSAIRHFASTAGRAFTNGSARHRKFWDLVESDCSPYAAYAISRTLFAPSEITALTRGQRSEVRGQQEETRRQRSEIIDRNSAVIGLRSSVSDERDLINEVSRYELTGYMSNTLLRDTDQMSMAHALEVRVPFVDREVVNYVMGLPGEWKMNGGRPKPLLVDALGDLLPEEIWRRPKMGFTLPFERWMRSSLATQIDEALSSGQDFTRIGIDPDHARSVWHAFKKNPQHQPWSRPWALYVLAKWCVLNGVAV